MQRNHSVASAILASRQTDITDNDDEPATWHEHPIAVAPHLVQFGKKLVVVFDVAQLSLACSIFFQRPIRRRCQH